RELPALADAAAPHVDVRGARLLDAFAIDIVEKSDVRRRDLAHGRQADPEDRNALALERGERVVDLLAVAFRPFGGAELDQRLGRLVGRVGTRRLPGRTGLLTGA